tara:strand:- start:49 stop:183 length:135 start_codon:yes stop_codon:yes gene_type:complete
MDMDVWLVDLKGIGHIPKKLAGGNRWTPMGTKVINKTKKSLSQQ